MKIALVKQLNNTFKIAFDSDYETAKKIKVGEIIDYESKRVRNPKFHRKFFALMNLVFQNQETYNSLEHLRKELIICAGHYDLIFDLETGEQKKEAQSIKFSSIDETEFNKIYNDVLDVIVQKFKFDKQSVIDNIDQHF